MDCTNINIMSVSKSVGKTFVWDPKSPATLLNPTITEDSVAYVDESEPKESSDNMLMNYMLCDSGSGCKPYESSAIMNLLDARDVYLEERKTLRNGAHHRQAIRKLSREYRKSLANCIGDWSEYLATKAKEEAPENEDEDQQQQQQQDEVNLYLLRSTYAVAHLSEIFVLLPSSQEDRDEMIHTVEFRYESNLWNLPGAVTADTIRYLRMHHLSDIEDLFDPSVLEDMYQSWQPDQYRNDGDDSARNTYWGLVEAYVVRGCLEEAWALLSHHSIVRRFVELEEQQRTNPGNLSLNDYQAASLAEDREGFQALRSILLSAPLPGGRNSDSDEGFDDLENKDNDTKEDNEDETDEEYIEGIPSSAYGLWETNGRKGNFKSRTGDNYISFEPNAAYQIHQYWKQAIDGIPALQRLRRRIPELNRLLALMIGNFRDIEFDSWEEEFCAELLYKNPNIQLDDMNVRAEALVRKYTNDGNETGKNMIDEFVITIMRGNAGQVVKVMHEFGGGSGAALPAVMTSLLSQLLRDASSLRNSSDQHNIELLLAASSSIRSSLATEGFFDLGTRLAVRLLLPHIQIDSDTRITATLVNTLEHHSPKSDGEANSLLLLCRNLIERKNVRVLDGCVSICLARHLYYMKESIPGGAVHWLLTGMDLESLVLCERSQDWQRALASGVCYRKLVAYFTETSRSLLKMLLGEEKGASLFYARAKEMVAATKEESSNANNLASYVAPVKLLENVIIIAGAIVERKDNSIVANGIISCLEERPNDEDDGVVSCLARSLNWDLMRLAIAVLDIDAKREETHDRGHSKEGPVSSFDVRGMGVLLSAFTIEMKTQELKEQDEKESTNFVEDELQRIRLTLAEGLRRAIVSENSMKRVTKTRKSKTKRYAANLSKFSREEQEDIVQNMLEY